MVISNKNMLAAVDLGSNSFRLQICQLQDGGLQVVDSIKEMVRFAGGLDEHKMLNEQSQQRALACLACFGERLRGFAAHQVRVVATNTFRVAKNIDAFIPQAEAVLGFPIEIIAGREEARLIYTGVVHTLPTNGQAMLVVDIGGGSTEFVIGRDLQPDVTESLNLGCVTYSMRFFPKGKVSGKSFQAAINAARTEVQSIAPKLRELGWQLAVGTSGTARALRDVLACSGDKHDLITLDWLKSLANQLIQAGSTKKANLLGLKSDRVEVFAGGLAVMIGIFTELKIQSMQVTDAALRDGVFYDMMGRQLDDDMRVRTVEEFQKRYHVDLSQADRVSRVAERFFLDLTAQYDAEKVAGWRLYVKWSAMLHEIGLSIAHTAYHKHAAYILENADMPGFSRNEQHILSMIVLGHRGDLRKISECVNDSMLWVSILSLRLAALFCRARLPVTLPVGVKLQYVNQEKEFILSIAREWLADNPLTASALQQESLLWEKIKHRFQVATYR